jgi:hypothetical protein
VAELTDAWLYEQLSYPLLLMEARRLHSELEKLTARAESVTRELDKRLAARKGPEPGAEPRPAP